MLNMLKYKFKFFLILGLILVGCIKEEKPEQKNRLVVLKENLDTVCVIEYYGEMNLETKNTITRKSISVKNNLYKQTKIIIKNDEKPIFKIMGSK